MPAFAIVAGTVKRPSTSTRTHFWPSSVASRSSKNPRIMGNTSDSAHRSSRGAVSPMQPCAERVEQPQSGPPQTALQCECRGETNKASEQRKRSCARAPLPVDHSASPPPDAPQPPPPRGQSLSPAPAPPPARGGGAPTPTAAVGRAQPPHGRDPRPSGPPAVRHRRPPRPPHRRRRVRRGPAAAAAAGRRRPPPRPPPPSAAARGAVRAGGARGGCRHGGDHRRPVLPPLPPPPSPSPPPPQRRARALPPGVGRHCRAVAGRGSPAGEPRLVGGGGGGGGRPCRRLRWGTRPPLGRGGWGGAAGAIDVRPRRACPPADGWKGGWGWPPEGRRALRRREGRLDEARGAEAAQTILPRSTRVVSPG